MKNFKKIFAVVLAALTIAFGIFSLINDQPIVGIDSLKALKFDNDTNIGSSILVILYLIVDILLIAAPAVLILLVVFDKQTPYKGIEGSALTVLIFFISRIFIFVLIMIVWKAPAELWKAYLFDKEALGIIPILVFFFAIILLIASSANKLEGTLLRAVLATAASALAIFGIVFYFVCGNGVNILMPTMDKTDTSTVFAIITGAILYAGLVVYTFLPQTREFKTE